MAELGKKTSKAKVVNASLLNYHQIYKLRLEEHNFWMSTLDKFIKMFPKSRSYAADADERRANAANTNQPMTTRTITMRL